MINNSVNKKATIHNVKVTCSGIAIFVSHYSSCSPRLFIYYWRLQKVKHNDDICSWNHPTYLNNYYRIMHDKLINTTELVIYADNFTSARTLRDLKV